MWNMTDKEFLEVSAYPQLRIEITAFGKQGTMKTTTLYKIQKLLKADGFTTRINEEAIPGIASRLEAVRNRSLKAYPEE